MALARDFKETILARIERNPAFRAALLKEGSSSKTRPVSGACISQLMMPSGKSQDEISGGAGLNLFS